MNSSLVEINAALAKEKMILKGDLSEDSNLILAASKQQPRPYRHSRLQSTKSPNEVIDQSTVNTSSEKAKFI